MGYTKKKTRSSDWLANWGNSIAVKITAPVFWILITVGLISVTIIQNQFAEQLPANISSDADSIAYATTSYLIELEGGQPLDLPQVIEREMADKYFIGGEISVGLRNLQFGERLLDQNHLVKVKRIVPYTNKKESGDALLAELTLYHKPLLRIIKEERKKMLLKYGFVLLVFGFLLAGLIHIMVTRPISRLLVATKAVSEGDMSSRLDNEQKDEFGELTEFFNRMLDKLQNKQEELALAVTVAESASNAKSAFLANMSHEIRTPLTAILGFSEMLKDDSLSKQELHQHVDSIVRAGNLLQQIINDILDMSKIEAGQLVIENNEVQLFAILNDIEQLMRPYAEEKQLRFRLKHNFPLPKVVVTDSTRLKQILLNLCSNAIKFTTDGNIDISVTYDKKLEVLQFDVTDTGMGMSQSELDRLFKPFSQADTSTTRQYGGSGLGLCICKELANSLGGDIECQSRKGIGSRFFFTINPGNISEEELVDAYDEVSIAASTTSIKIKPDSLTGKVLLAEDTLDNQKLISLYIRRAGATPVVVENGKQALDEALARDYDLILMDMQMPVMGGIDATSKLRAAGYTKPIVALTANALKEDREKSQKAGVDDYLTKPVDLNRFNEVLTHYLKPKLTLSTTKTAQNRKNSTVDFTDDPEFQSLVQKFEEELPIKIQQIEYAAEIEDFQVLKTHVHKLKGLAASFGYPELSSISSQIQHSIVNKGFSSVPELVKALVNSYQQYSNQNKLSSNF